jgi:hypothetical protein
VDENQGVAASLKVISIPTLILLVPVTWALIKVAMDPFKYDTFKADYDEYGQPKREKVNVIAEPDVAQVASTRE